MTTATATSARIGQRDLSAIERRAMRKIATTAAGTGAISSSRYKYATFFGISSSAAVTTAANTIARSAGGTAARSRHAR
jgi:hypothetical protein